MLLLKAIILSICGETRAHYNKLQYLHTAGRIIPDKFTGTLWKQRKPLWLVATYKTRGNTSSAHFPVQHGVTCQKSRIVSPSSMSMGLSIVIETLKNGFSVVITRKITQEFYSSRIFRYVTFIWYWRFIETRYFRIIICAGFIRSVLKSFWRLKYTRAGRKYFWTFQNIPVYFVGFSMWKEELQVLLLQQAYRSAVKPVLQKCAV